MSETWYVVPAAFALRDVARESRADEATSWILPEAWRRPAGPIAGLAEPESKAADAPGASHQRRIG